MNFPSLPKITTKSSVATIILGGYVLAIGTLVWHRAPPEQLDIIDKALVGLGTLCGAIINSLFNNQRTRT